MPIAGVEKNTHSGLQGMVKGSEKYYSGNEKSRSEAFPRSSSTATVRVSFIEELGLGKQR
jgi:hypothetical protein